MFSTCSEFTPRAPILDGRMEQIMQPWPLVAIWCMDTWFPGNFHRIQEYRAYSLTPDGVGDNCRRIIWWWWLCWPTYWSNMHDIAIHTYDNHSNYREWGKLKTPLWVVILIVVAYMHCPTQPTKFFLDCNSWANNWKKDIFHHPPSLLRSP